MIQTCVDPCVCHGFGIEFDADDFLCLFVNAKRDRTDTAVGIQQTFFAGQLQQFISFLIKPFALVMIDLIKRGRGNDETFAQQFIFNASFSI